MPLPFLPATATRPRATVKARPEKSGGPEKDFSRFSAESVVGRHGRGSDDTTRRALENARAGFDMIARLSAAPSRASAPVRAGGAEDSSRLRSCSMLKRALFLLLLTAASLSLLACGGKKDEDALMEDEGHPAAAAASAAGRRAGRGPGRRSRRGRRDGDRQGQLRGRGARDGADQDGRRRLLQVRAQGAGLRAGSRRQPEQDARSGSSCTSRKASPGATRRRPSPSRSTSTAASTARTSSASRPASR